MLDLNLINTWQVILDRILCSNDLAIRPIELIQSRIQRGGLPRSGRAGNQENAIGPFDDGLEPAVVFPPEPQITDVHGDSPAIQDTHNGGLTMDGGQAADAEV